MSTESQEIMKRIARNRTAKHLYPNLRKCLLNAKKARLKDNFEEELKQLEYTLYGVQRRISEVHYVLDHRKDNGISSNILKMEHSNENE